MGGIALRTELDRIPLWQGDHIGIKQLSDYFAKHLYLPRLRDEQVLLDATQEGVASLSWQTDTFAYAEGWNETRGKYEGLRGGNQVRVLLNERSVVVKPDAAQAQLLRETPATTANPTSPTSRDGFASSGQTTGSTGSATTTASEGPSGPRRFHGSVRVDPVRLGRDASRIAEEIVQHLTSLVGSNVEVTIDIQAELAEPASDKLVRDVTENCRTLRFTDHGFEDS